MTRKKLIILVVVLAAVLLFIWGNSVLSQETSDALSRWVSELFGGNKQDSGSDLNHFMRKLAHFSEFLALGVVLWLVLSNIIRAFRTALCIQAFCGLLTAVVDETIQIFNSRGPSLADVWLDYCGFFLGSCICIALVILIRRHKAKKETDGEKNSG